MLQYIITIYTVNIFALVFLFGLLHFDKVIDNMRKKAFSFAIILIIIIICAEVGTIIVGDGANNLRALHIIFNIIGFGLSPIIPLVLTNIFDSKVLNKFKLLYLRP